MTFVKTKIFAGFFILLIGFIIPSFADADCHDQIVNSIPSNFSDEHILDSIKNSTEYRTYVEPLWEFRGISYGGTVGPNCSISSTDIDIVVGFSSIYVSPLTSLSASLILDSQTLEIKDVNIAEGRSIMRGDGSFKKLLSPHIQTKYGVAPDNVLCNRGLELVIKNDGSAACIKPETKIKLLERGWLNQ